MNPEAHAIAHARFLANGGVPPVSNQRHDAHYYAWRSHCIRSAPGFVPLKNDWPRIPPRIPEPCGEDYKPWID